MAWEDAVNPALARSLCDLLTVVAVAPGGAGFIACDVTQLRGGGAVPSLSGRLSVAPGMRRLSGELVFLAERAELRGMPGVSLKLEQMAVELFEASRQLMDFSPQTRQLPTCEEFSDPQEELPF